ncbi:MAG TPA: ATP synthase subunit I [Terriglobales bacterium]|nr:ATP synthase subunit I [Terriglobales bacterium]
MATEQPSADAFYAAAYPRIVRFMLVLAVVFVPLGWLWKGTAFALGLAAGCAIALVNFHWLKRTVSAVADRITGSGRAEPARGVVLRFLLRYVLLAVGAYVIVKSSAPSVYGLLAGLFLPVGAIACEAAYEAWVALRRGI